LRTAALIVGGKVTPTGGSTVRLGPHRLLADAEKS
jgi:hypothetical protein